MKSIYKIKTQTVKRGGGIILRETKAFRVRMMRSGRLYIECLDPHSEPRVRRISRRDAHYLVHELGEDFDNACIVDFGVGVFQKP
jgi:hypothetical protein